MRLISQPPGWLLLSLSCGALYWAWGGGGTSLYVSGDWSNSGLPLPLPRSPHPRLLGYVGEMGYTVAFNQSSKMI